MIPIYIGCSPDGRDDLAVDVLEHSILANTEAEVEFHRIGDGKGDTGFTSARWQLCREEGYAIYLDSDMMVFADILDLWEYRRSGKWIGSSTRKSKATSVSVVHGSALQLFDISTMKDLQKYNCYEALIPDTWNWMDATPVETTNLLHFSHQALQPWKDSAPKDREIDELWLRYSAQIR